MFMRTYCLDTAGRRSALLLTLGAVVVWGFALWQLPHILSSETVRVSYANFPSTLTAAVRAGLTVAQIVPALLFIVMIVAVPLLIWNLFEEWATCYNVRDDGLEYCSLGGISILYPWTTITRVRQVDPEADEAVHEVVVDQPGASQIRNPVLRFLHRQAFGQTRIPIYAHVRDRDELLREIVMRSGLQAIQGDERKPAT